MRSVLLDNLSETGALQACLAAKCILRGPGKEKIEFKYFMCTRRLGGGCKRETLYFFPSLGHKLVECTLIERDLESCNLKTCGGGGYTSHSVYYIYLLPHPVSHMVLFLVYSSKSYWPVVCPASGQVVFLFFTF
jgi:hypothetical protein